MLNEADIIQNLSTAFAPRSGVVGIGDDAAVIPLNDRESYVITKDILVEHKHFRLSTTSATQLAHKALHVNLSDIAAMGAKPLYALLGLALPKTIKPDWIKNFSKGFSAACSKVNVQLIGGDTTASDRDVMISITMIGQAKKNHLKFRKNAQVGEIICVAGTLGESYAGLMALERKAKQLTDVKSKSLRPVALVAEGQWLGAQPAVTAMMDVSDGLYVDLGKMLQLSKVGAEVNLNRFHPTLSLVKACATLRLNISQAMLAGGEDYALLFTVKAGGYAQLAGKFHKQFGYPLMPIGKVTASKKITLQSNGQIVPFTGKIFSHFGEL